MAKFIVSQKGHKKLVVDEYIFTRQRTGINNKVYWICEVRTCRSRVQTVADVVIKAPTEHNHAPLHGKVAVEEMREGMKRRAEVTEEKTRQIVHSSMTSIKLDHAHLLPGKGT